MQIMLQVSLDGWAKMDEESIVAANPDVIITTHGFRTKDANSQVLKRSGWEDVTAIKNKQVYRCEFGFS